MRELQELARGEGRTPGQHLVERGAERVQVGPAIDQAFHAAGLLGGHVGERAFELSGHAGHLGKGGHGGRRFEIDQRDPPLIVDDEILRADVPVDHPARVDVADRLGHGVRQLQEGVDGERATVHALGQVARTGVLEHERRVTFEGRELERSRRGARVQGAEDLVFVTQACLALELGPAGAVLLDDDLDAVGAARSKDGEPSA
jgi:hypothetical protein